MKTDWNGRYLDGNTAVSKKAEIHLLETGLQILLEDGTSLNWPYDQIRQAQGRYSGEPVRLERSEGLFEALIVEDTDFLVSLRSMVPQKAFRFHNPGFRRARVWLTIYAAIATLLVGLGLYRWGVPYLVHHITPLVPVSWEKKLGESQLDILAPSERRIRDPRMDRALQKIVDRLSATLRHCPYHFKVVVCDLPMFNAFALPGGPIVVLRELLVKTRSPEELAGVLAHEMQHVLKRHTTQKIIQDSSTGLLISAMAGDATGSMAFGLQSARNLALLEYGREEEAEADQEGMKMILAARINPAGMIRFFEELQKVDKMPEFLKYVSSHPATVDRIKNLRRLASSFKGSNKTLPLLPGTNWAGLLKTLPKAK